MSPSMDLTKRNLRHYKPNETSPLLYDIEGHITIFVKSTEAVSMSFRQLIQSLPPVIIGHMVYQHENWINAGALMAEHLAKKFVPRALNWVNNINPYSMELEYHFETHIKGYSPQSKNSNDIETTTLRGTSIAEWNGYPYRVDYEFLYNISSTAKKNYKRLIYQNDDEYKLRDEQFKNYIQAIVNSQSVKMFNSIYDVYEAMNAVMFLVE